MPFLFPVAALLFLSACVPGSAPSPQSPVPVDPGLRSETPPELHRPTGLLPTLRNDTPEFRGVQRKAIAEETNQARAKGGMPPLQVHPALERAAQRFSEELASREVVEHESLDPERREPKQRVLQEGVRGRWVGENAASQPSCLGDSLGVAVVKAWLDSPGHRDNILRPRYQYLGVGLAQGRSGMWYLIQMFAEDILPVPSGP